MHKAYERVVTLIASRRRCVTTTGGWFSLPNADHEHRHWVGWLWVNDIVGAQALNTVFCLSTLCCNCQLTSGSWQLCQSGFTKQAEFNCWTGIAFEQRSLSVEYIWIITLPSLSLHRDVVGWRYRHSTLCWSYWFVVRWEIDPAGQSRIRKSKAYDACLEPKGMYHTPGIEYAKAWNVIEKARIQRCGLDTPPRGRLRSFFLSLALPLSYSHSKEYKVLPWDTNQFANVCLLSPFI